MPQDTESNLAVFWIEDQLAEIEWGVKLFTGMLQNRVGKHVLIDDAKTVEEAEGKLNGKRTTPPDLIILDIMLPRTQKALQSKRVDLNAGFFLWYRLRQKKTWGDALAMVPILVVTARGNVEYIPRMLEGGRLGWISKPVGPSEMVDAVVKLLDQVKAIPCNPA